ncbi:MAG: YfdX family protein [Bacteroidales bacterium]|nr:YfdX family protein [Bacteroidales bacterium]
MTFILVFLLTGLTSCNSGQDKAVHSTSEIKFRKPDSLYMSKHVLANKVQAEAQQEIKKQQERFVKEALDCITETNETLKALASGKMKEAQKQLHLALVHATQTMKKHPNVYYVPVNISVSSNDFVKNRQQADQLVTETKKALAGGSYQNASSLLNKLKSEIDITTINMLFSNYPRGLAKADSLLNVDKTNDAENILYGLLNSLQITQVVLPLPVLRAQALIAQAKEVDNQNHAETKVDNLLENANYQLLLAKTMGYGSFDTEYTDLSKQIKSLEQGVQSGTAGPEDFSGLFSKVEQFKSRLFDQSHNIR